MTPTTYVLITLAALYAVVYFRLGNLLMYTFDNALVYNYYPSFRNFVPYSCSTDEGDYQFGILVAFSSLILGGVSMGFLPISSFGWRLLVLAIVLSLFGFWWFARLVWVHTERRVAACVDKGTAYNLLVSILAFYALFVGLRGVTNSLSKTIRYMQQTAPHTLRPQKIAVLAN